VGFEQATIPVQQQTEFRVLKEAIDRVFSAPALERFLAGLKRQGVSVREFEQVLAKGLIERADAQLKKAGRAARQIYQSLPLSDQAQVREFYLMRLEQVPDEWRAKFSTVYRLV
jgi:hypothetical protein